MLRAFMDFAEAVLLLAEGRFDRLEPLVAQVIASGVALGEGTSHHIEALLLAARVATMTGIPSRFPLPDDASIGTDADGKGHPARMRIALRAPSDAFVTAIRLQCPSGRLPTLCPRGATLERSRVWCVPAPPSLRDTSMRRARAARASIATPPSRAACFPRPTLGYCSAR